MIGELQSEWTSMRQLTLDVLRVCTPDDLAFRPQPSVGVLWKQFRHIARIHGHYLDALETGSVRFDMADATYCGDGSRESLLAYFEEMDQRHEALFTSADPNGTIDWFGEPASTQIHLIRLISHETLHHGELMIYWRALGHSLPKSWAVWGEA